VGFTEGRSKQNHQTEISHEFDSLLLEREGLSGESGLIILVWLTRILPHHVVDPPAVRLQVVTRGELGREVHPSSSVTPSTDFVGDTVLGLLAHALVEGLVRPEVVQVLCNSRRVADVDEETVLAVLDLEGDTTGTRANDRFALVDGL